MSKGGLREVRTVPKVTQHFLALPYCLEIEEIS